jgi:AraC-like DNA-binding protein/mannose-6-phosphate isomerase-like protein (cupin superfamily)
MAKKVASLPLSGETEWLGLVREVRHPIDPGHPLRVSHRRVMGDGGLPLPSVPFPERHPYCEINFVVEGKGEQLIGMEKVMRTPGDLMLIGPGIPHYGTFVSFPVRMIVVHFLPILLFEMAPGGDGARILSRFTSSRSISQRVIKPPRGLQRRFASLFESMAREFDHPRFGSDLCVRSRLMDALVELLRWEDSAGGAIPHQPVSSDWGQIEKILNFIYRHYTEPLYIEQIAREVGLSTENLHTLFCDTFGMTCVQYLRAYRISHAASLLCLPGSRVTEVAFAVGFETLSYFNTSFRRFQGMSPRDYMRFQKAK